MSVPKRTRETAKIGRGRQGWWFVPVTFRNGESKVLPCVHKQWVQMANGEMRYQDPWHGLSLDDPRLLKQIESINNNGLVALTDDDYFPEFAAGGGRFSRKGYIAVYKVDNPIRDQRGFGLNFVERVADAA